MTGPFRRWWRSVRTRRRVAQALAMIGALLATIGVISGRHGWLVAGLVLVVVAVSLAPWRLRR